MSPETQGEMAAWLGSALLIVPSSFQAEEHWHIKMRVCKVYVNKAGHMDKHRQK